MDLLTSFLSLLHPIVLLFYFITILVVVFVIILENRNPVKTISWVLVLVLLPVIGFVFFIFFGQNLRKEKIIAKKGLHNQLRLSKMADSQVSKLSDGDLFVSNSLRDKRKIISLLLNNSNSIVTINNKVEILKDGEETFNSMISAIEEAKEYIHLEYYIFVEDDIGSKIKDILIKKASEGVKVRIIVDDVGSWQLKKPFFKEMKDAGIEAYSFLKVRFPTFTSKVNYRNHRKILIVDGKVGFLGGVNIADRYLYGKPQLGPWRDTHLKVEGDSVHSLQSIFLTDWYFVSQEELYTKEFFPLTNIIGNTMLQIVASGPDSDWPGIMMGIFQAIASAKEYVYIATPYFMVNEGVLMALKTAAMGNVDVKIILPEKSDSRITHLSTRSFIREMLDANVKIYFYHTGFIHSKVMIIDDMVSKVGSANMDFRSFEHNYEVEAFIYDREIALELKSQFNEDLKNSYLVTIEQWIKRPPIQKIKESFARLISPLL